MSCDFGIRHRVFSLIAVLTILAPAYSEDEVRTWSDTSGQFKIEAKFVSEKNGTVTLKQEDGEEIEIPLAKLSAADQKAIAEAKKKASDSPFKSKSASPFKSKDKPSMPGKGSTSKDPSDSSGSEPRNVKVNWSKIKTVTFAGLGDSWKVDVPEGLDQEAFKPKPVTLPGKKDFFEGLRSLAVSPDGKKVVAGYLMDQPQPKGSPRLVICDLETGESTPPVNSTGMMIPLALHNDGQHVLLRSDVFGFGNHDRLEIWKVNESKIDKLATWIPYENAHGPDRDMLWGAFIGNDRFATYGNRELAIWSFPDVKPLLRIPVDGSGRPAVSPDGKHIAICDGKSVGLFNFETREIDASQALPEGHFPWPNLAFSPAGNRLACVCGSRLFVWDVSSGELVVDITDTGLPPSGPPLFPHEDYVLIAGKYLLGVQNRVKLWSYESPEQYAMSGPYVIYAATEGEKPGLLMANKLPHAAAVDLLMKAMSDPTLFIMHAGTKVKLDLTGIGDASKRNEVSSGLTTRLKAIGCEVDNNGTITLAASTEESKEEKTLRFRHAGEFKTREYISRVKFVYEGKTVWERSATNIQHFGMIRLEAGENIATYLKKREKTNYAFFDQIDLPHLIQKPGAGGGAKNSLTIGTSRVTPSGMR